MGGRAKYGSLQFENSYHLMTWNLIIGCKTAARSSRRAFNKHASNRYDSNGHASSKNAGSKKFTKKKTVLNRF